MTEATAERIGPPNPLGADLERAVGAGAFLLIDKPRGPSSHQVTAWVRDLLGVRSAGHAGTLDPQVSGLLWVGVGPALKLLPLLLAFPKRYIGLVTLHARVPARALKEVLAEFEGPIYQTPPVRSAVRRERRIRRIHRLNLIEQEGTDLLLDVTADSGTYIRTLAVDLGDALGVGGHLAELRRVGTGPFREASAISLAELADARARYQAGDPAALLRHLHPMEEVWREFPALQLKDGAAAAVAHGAGLARGGIRAIVRPFGKGSYVVLLSRANELLAFGRARVGSDDLETERHGWVVESERVLADPSRYPASWNRPKVTAR
ncbi:MAG TPA: RNA-guided pseudouridylation complex pseudouridine synthase subunit Cbf5 [Thermoplasmata archaeon]|nr:RNA-guided pseudouridylation complex pseudouridine synthase subunit Cbf5 [Thermoplasmata archaeon]